MKLVKLLPVLLALSVANCGGGDQQGSPLSLDWAKIVADKTAFGSDTGLALLPDGSVILAGTHDFSLTLGDARRSVKLTGTATSSGYVARFAANGQLEWAKAIAGQARLAVTNIDDQSVLVTGGGLMRRFASDGTLLWEKPSPGSAVAVSAGAILVAGAFYEEIHFTGMSLTPAAYDVFLAKYDLDGVLQWARPVLTAFDVEVQDIDLLADGSLVATGWFARNATFDKDGPHETSLRDDPGGNTATRDAWVARFDNMGQLAWARSVKGPGDFNAGLGVAVFPDGSLAMAGVFTGTVTFDPVATKKTLTSNGMGDGFVARYSNSGDLVWAKGLGGVGFDSVQAAVAAPNGNVILTGGFVGKAHLLGKEHTGRGKEDIFLAEVDSGGDAKWIETAGGRNVEFLSSDLAAVNAGGSIAIAGRTGGPTTLFRAESSDEIPVQDPGVFLAMYRR